MRPDGRRIPFIPCPTPLYDAEVRSDRCNQHVGGHNRAQAGGEQTESPDRRAQSRVRNTLATVQCDPELVERVMVDEMIRVL